MRWVQWLAYATAILLRLWTSHNYSAALQERIELSSPLTSFRRLQEGVFLEEQSPGKAYAGWAFHQPPITLYLFQQLRNYLPHIYHLIWLTVDLLSALLIYLITRKVLSADAQHRHSIEPMRVTKDIVDVVPHVASIWCGVTLLSLTPFLSYLLHPYGWLSTAALSLTMIDNLFILGALFFGLADNYVLAPLCVALATYTSFYPIMLISPVTLLISRERRLNCVLIFAFWLYSLGLVSYLITGPGQWGWLKSTYLYILKVEDLTPNIGLFWYYFLETFTHYRNFFLLALQMHTFSYAIPCTMRLKDQPLLLSVITLFKPYPVVGDVLLQLSLIPIFYKILFYLKFSFILLNIHIYISLLFPILWYMWVETGSGNANFVYAITLVHAIADGLLVSEVVATSLSWRYSDKHKVPMVPKPGKQADGKVGEADAAKEKKQ